MNSSYNGLTFVRRAARTIFGKRGARRRDIQAKNPESGCALWLCCLTLLLAAPATPAFSQQRVYFVDGYHGGIYGHYPVEWKTRFITDELEAHPEWRICLEIEPETWDTVALRTPADYARLKAIATDRRVEFTNPTYAQPYCYNISGESLIRQFGYGMRKIRSHFPDVEFVTYAVEEPCFTSCLPQILRLYGFEYASLKCPNTCWGGYTAPYGGELVNWTGPDGSSILTSPRHACEELQENSVWQTTAWGNEKEYLDACIAYGIAHPVGMCFQDAGWKYGPWIGSGDSIRNNSTYVTWREYFEQVTDRTTTDDYRMPQEDVRVSLMWGSQVLQRIAQQVRQSENRLLQAEKAGVIAHLTNGYRYEQATLDEAWRTLMLAQHHDSWIVPYNGLHKQGTWAQHIRRWTAATDALCDGVIAQAQQSFAGDGNGGKAGGIGKKDSKNGGENETDGKGEAFGDRREVYLRVSNTLGTARRQTVSAPLPEGFGDGSLTVEDARGKQVEHYVVATVGQPRIVFRADVPAFGYATYRIGRGKQAAAKKGTGAAEKRIATTGKGTAEKGFATTGKGTGTAQQGTAARPQQGEYVLENDMYRIVIDPAKGGVITSLVARKEGGKEFAEAQGKRAFGELRGFFYDEGRFHSSAEAPAEVTVVCDNALEKSVRICGKFASHPFTQTVTIRKGERKIDFDLRIDWQHNVGIGAFRQKDAFNNNHRAFYDDRFNLNILFPVDLDAPALYKDAPFDVCKSTLENTHFTTWDNIKHNIVLHWVDLAERDGGYGMALLSDHTTSYSYGGDAPLGLTVQFSGNGLWGRDYPIDGPTHIRFAVVPHRKAWDAAGIQQESRSWNEPLLCTLLPHAATGDTSLIDVTGSGYELTAAYLEGDQIVVRLFNADGDAAPRKIRFGFPLSKAEQTDLNGTAKARCDIRKRGHGAEIELAMPRFGLTTLRLTK